MSMLRDIDWNNPREVEIETRRVMGERNLIWDDGPTWRSVPAPGTPQRAIRILQGRLLSTVSGKTEFVESLGTEIDFWTNAREIVLDTKWDEPD